jgi:hypothetical protein
MEIGKFIADTASECFKLTLISVGGFIVVIGIISIIYANHPRFKVGDCIMLKEPPLNDMHVAYKILSVEKDHYEVIICSRLRCAFVPGIDFKSQKHYEKVSCPKE